MEMRHYKTPGHFSHEPYMNSVPVSHFGVSLKDTSIMSSLATAFIACPWVILLGLGLPFILTYLSTTIRASKGFRSAIGDSRPPVAPYWVPFLGHGLSFFRHTAVVSRLTK